MASQPLRFTSSLGLSPDSRLRHAQLLAKLLGAIKKRKKLYVYDMKVQLQYLNDQEGNLIAVQVPIEDWKKLEKRIRNYEQAFKVKEDLTAAFEEVKQIRAGKIPKQTLSDFLQDLKRDDKRNQ